MWPKSSGLRDWRAEALDKKIAQATHLRQLAKGSKKKLSRSEERCILAASQRAK